ncbi:MAG: peptidylprolyl isomerase [Oscillospiraceae bacterium]|nr:peptidylprolyl isomerase [Oscillospiraceae bacterium]
MNLRKLIGSVLCIILLVFILSGCDGPESDTPVNDEDNPQENPGVHTDGENDLHDHHGSFDFEAALSFFPPDTVMARSGDMVLTWAELYIFLHRSAVSLLHSLGGPIDWSEEIEPGSSLSELVLDYATEEALSFMAFEFGANSIGFELSEDDLNEFNSELNHLFEMYDGKDAFEASLRENSGFYNLELFEKLYKVEFLISNLIENLYGEDGAAFSDEDVSVFEEENDFMMAMHILRLKSDEEGADPMGEAEDILNQLNEKIGSDNFEEFFEELMLEHSEDFGGLMSYPKGYLFLHADMVSQFSDATAALEIGEISGIVESTYGYHIILRLPIDYDVIPSGYSREGIMRSLRQIAALFDFDALQNDWFNSLNAEFTPEYYSINLESIFIWQEEDCDH